MSSTKKNSCYTVFFFVVVCLLFFLDYSYYYSGYYQAAAEPVYNTATEIQETSEMYPVAAETEAASLQQSDEVNVTDTEVTEVHFLCCYTVILCSYDQ